MKRISQIAGDVLCVGSGCKGEMMLFCIWEKYTLKKCPSDCQTRSESTEKDRGPMPIERHMYSLELLPVSKTFTLWQWSTPGRLLMPGKFGHQHY
jgi:hypothetical protein